MADFGSVASQYFRTSQAADAIDQAVEKLRSQPIGRLDGDNEDLGRYLATLAGLIDPAHADQIDARFANTTPSGLVMSLAARLESEPELSDRLADAAGDLLAERTIDTAEVELIESVARMATDEATRLSHELLA
jgi:hypothetical protein